MSKALKIAAVIVGAFAMVFVLLLLGGSLISGDVELETEATLPAPPEVVYRYLTTEPGVQAWWTTAGANMSDEGYPALDIVGEGEGVGMVVRFEAAGQPFEVWTLTGATPHTTVSWKVDFQMFVVDRTFTLTPAEGGTHLRWHEQGHIDNVLMRYFKLLMSDDDAVANFDLALVALDETIRAEAAMAPPQPEVADTPDSP